ncbi:MAG: hypothetical protein ACTS73_02535 [Arsenophonus sp. NEOnobi-MAG3]
MICHKKSTLAGNPQNQILPMIPCINSSIMAQGTSDISTVKTEIETMLRQHAECRLITFVMPSSITVITATNHTKLLLAILRLRCLKLEIDGTIEYASTDRC